MRRSVKAGVLLLSVLVLLIGLLLPDIAIRIADGVLNSATWGYDDGDRDFTYPGAEAHRIQAFEAYENMAASIKATQENVTDGAVEPPASFAIRPDMGKLVFASQKSFTLSPIHFSAQWDYLETKVCFEYGDVRIVTDEANGWPLRMEIRTDASTLSDYLSGKEIYSLLREYGALFGFSEYKEGYGDTQGTAVTVVTLSVAATNYEISLFISQKVGILVFKISVV